MNTLLKLYTLKSKWNTQKDEDHANKNAGKYQQSLYKILLYKLGKHSQYHSNMLVVYTKHAKLLSCNIKTATYCL